MRELELYLHIPFCVRKCAYCDFLSFPAGEESRRSYVDALKREIVLFPYKEEYRVGTVFFGGGTPSLLSGGQLVELLGLLRETFRFEREAEISMECNPGTADEGKLRLLYEAGVNRLSFGLQSADNRELALLGRIHTWETFLRTYEAARNVGFQNINVDLMSALPGQTVASWERTLRAVLALGPEHISAYSLIIEEGTPFFETYHEDDELRACGEQPKYLPSEEEERRMYELTGELLAQAGLRRYEISNYARPGYECRHNIGYWRGTEYAGFGLGAASLLREMESRGDDPVPKARDGKRAGCPDAGADAERSQSGACRENQEQMPQEQRGADADSAAIQYVRYRNTDDRDRYLAGDFTEREKIVLSQRDRMEEFMFLGLRMSEGVSEEEFAGRFGRSIDEVYGPVLEKLVWQALIERKDGRIALTARGIDLSNGVMAEFL